MAFPKNQPEINSLLQMWKVKLPDYQTQFNLSGEQINQQFDDAIFYAQQIEARDMLDAEVDELAAYRKQGFTGEMTGTMPAYPTLTLPPLPTAKGVYRPGIEQRNAELYNFLKGHPSRTPEALADLGIGTTTSQPVLVDDLKPHLSGKPRVGDAAAISFDKQGQPKCRIEMRRGSDLNFNSIGEPDTSPFEDETPSVDGKPEKREYRGIYIKNNKPVGQYSDIIVIYTTP